MLGLVFLLLFVDDARNRLMKEISYPEPAKSILRYFVRNPKAADTCEGIAKWRLLEETIHHTTAETAEAVDWLEARGYLQRVPGVSSAPLFMLDQTRLKEIADFLEETERRKDPTALDRGR